MMVALSACGAIQQQQAEREQKKQEFTHRVDFAHIWVTTESPGPGKPYTVLGNVDYTEPFTPDAIDEAKIKEHLKKAAFEKWPDTVDAVVKENQEISADGSQVKVTGEAIQYESSVDRNALHKMNEGMVASPNGNRRSLHSSRKIDGQFPDAGIARFSFDYARDRIVRRDR
jgi:hypothetical protein